MSEIRHILGISGGKDSAALAIYMKKKYPQLKIVYYNSDTGCDLHETELLVNRLDTYLGGIIRLRAAEGSPEPTPFEHFLKASGNYLPSPQARWCTQKMKLAEMEKFIGDAPTISYVGIRGDEDREGYVSSKPNIQSIFPFRKNIWSVDVINKVLHNDNLAQLRELYNQLCPKAILPMALKIVDTPISKEFFYGKKANALLDFDVKLFNHVVFEFLKTTDYPAMIELLSRHEDIFAGIGGEIEPLPIDEEVSSLSAIIMNDDYYHYTLKHRVNTDGISHADPAALIALKTRAYLNLLADKAAGKTVKEKDIKKHRSDVLKLVATLPADENIMAPQAIVSCIHDFVKVLHQDWASLGTQLAQALDNSEAFVSALLEQLDNLFIEEA